MDNAFSLPGDDDHDDENNGPLPPPPDENGDNWRDDLGLPLNDARPPSVGAEMLQRAIESRLARERAFLLANRDQPEIIARRMGEIARSTKAMLAVQGPFRPKVMRFALELEPRYWAAYGHLDEGLKFCYYLISVAFNLKDSQLQSRVFALWGHFTLFLRRETVTHDLFTWALEKIEETDRADLKLLLRTELFNARVLKMKPAELAAEAETLLAEAEQLHFPYIKGRVYYTLARYYQYIGERIRAFEYAQQSLCYFYPDNTLELTTQVVGSMYANIAARGTSHQAYVGRLLSLWDQLVARNINPWYRAAALHFQAHEFFVRAFYHRARYYILHAWLTYCSVPDRVGCTQAQHMLGLLHTKLGNWKAAQYHLQVAWKRYAALGDTIRALHALHAWAYVEVERQNYACALYKLLKVRKDILKHVDDPEMRKHMLDLIDADIAEMRKHVQENHDGANPCAEE